MKSTQIKRWLGLVLALVMALGLMACGGGSGGEVGGDTGDTAVEPPKGEILFYGEYHNSESCTMQELKYWQDCYAKGMRHLFLEMGEGTAQLLNMWMAAEDDTLVQQVYDNTVGTAAHTHDTLEFYQQVKATCPETVFHGFDVEHQYKSSGDQCLALLEPDSDTYNKVSAGMDAAKEFYRLRDEESGAASEAYREPFMANSVIADYDALGGVSIMVVADAAHVDNENSATSEDQAGLTIMADLVKEHYGDAANVVCTVLDINVPVRMDELTIGGKTYQAEYFGCENVSKWLEGCDTREYWHIMDGYDDFSQYKRASAYLPGNNYVMDTAENEVYAILYHYADGTEMWWYAVAYSDDEWGMMTQQVVVPGTQRIDELTIGGKTYQAEYMGSADVSSWLEGCKSREFWHVLNGFDDFNAWPRSGDMLPQSNYPYELDAGEAYAILYHYTDGTEGWWYGVSSLSGEFGVNTFNVIAQ